MTTIPLTPIDHIFTGVGSYPIEFVFAYRETIDARKLERSLSEIVRRFPPIGSKLLRTSDHSFALQPSPDGLHFQTIEASTSFDDQDARYDFLDPVSSVEGEPLTRIRLTQTPEGSVLGVSMSHAVGDGFSYFFFLSSWARLFHRQPVLDPSHQRELLSPGPADDGEPVTRERVLSDAGIFWEGRRPSVERSHMQWDRFHVPKAEISRLLQKAQQDCDARLSHNDVISADLWRTYVARWDSQQDSTTYASCPVDVRRILKPFPRTYFGNAVALATTSLERSELAQAPLGGLASMIRSAVAAVDAGYMQKSLATLEALRAQQGLSVVEENHVIHPRSGILITNLSRLPVQEIVFDAGPPVAFDILTPAQRGAVVLPAEDGVDVRVCYPIGMG
ncbi:MAG: hypothetical protein JSV86_12945 [Gemmatimonadota bacterium]|nr:MAG: hypothetical protein JSV86_12945 [Gemmatimonadota bacterium]